MFAIEVTSTFFMVGNLWKACFCAAVGYTLYRYLHGLTRLITPYKQTTFEEVHFDWTILLYGVLGAICGAIAVVFNDVLTKLIFFRTKVKIPYVRDRWKYCMIAVLFTSIISYPAKFF